MTKASSCGEPDNNNGGRFVSEMFGDERQGAKKFQEDAHFMFKSPHASPDGALMVAGVFDGHGRENGMYASRCAKSVAVAFFKDNWKLCLQWDEETWCREFKQLFNRIHSEIRNTFREVRICVFAVVCVCVSCSVC